MKCSPHNLIILISPPATGKTFWIRHYAAAIFPRTMLVLSPLRALADECRDHFPSNVQVMTPEEWCLKKAFPDVVIFDEFHLNFYWGDSFRPLMWEVFFDLSSIAELTICLSATVGQKMKDEISLMKANFDEILWLDFGNQKLKNRPCRYFKAPGKQWIRNLMIQSKKGETNLVFCAFREEVHKVGMDLREQGYSVWTCVGGGAKEFAIKVKTLPPPDFIVATSVLSHGVNLPVLKKIFMLYEIENIDFWIQMVARGGRRGEKFEVFALEKPVGLRWNKVINDLAIFRISLRMKFILSLRQVQSWFLKESSSPESPTKNAI